MPANWNFITYFELELYYFITYFVTGFPRTTGYIFVYVHCYICCRNSVDFEKSNACINTTIIW